MRESRIEGAWRSLAKRFDGLFYKFKSPNNRGVPDRLLLYPIPPEHQEIVAKYVEFIEFKAPGKKPTTLQLRKHKELTDRGYRVRVIDSL